MLRHTLPEVKKIMTVIIIFPTYILNYFITKLQYMCHSFTREALYINLNYTPGISKLGLVQLPEARRSSFVRMRHT